MRAWYASAWYIERHTSRQAVSTTVPACRFGPARYSFRQCRGEARRGRSKSSPIRRNSAAKPVSVVSVWSMRAVRLMVRRPATGARRTVGEAPSISRWRCRGCGGLGSRTARMNEVVSAPFAVARQVAAPSGGRQAVPRPKPTWFRHPCHYFHPPGSDMPPRKSRIRLILNRKGCTARDVLDMAHSHDWKTE